MLTLGPTSSQESPANITELSSRLVLSLNKNNLYMKCYLIMYAGNILLFSSCNYYPTTGLYHNDTYPSALSQFSYSFFNFFKRISRSSTPSLFSLDFVFEQVSSILPIQVNRIPRIFSSLQNLLIFYLVRVRHTGVYFT